MEIKNLTPHAITICNNAGEVIRVFQSEGLVRLKASTVNAGQIDGVPVSNTIFGEPEGLPEYTDGKFYIVSQIVKSALPKRLDLLVPAEIVRDLNGQIIGCKSLGL